MLGPAGLVTVLQVVLLSVVDWVGCAARGGRCGCGGRRALEWVGHGGCAAVDRSDPRRFPRINILPVCAAVLLAVVLDPVFGRILGERTSALARDV